MQRQILFGPSDPGLFALVCPRPTATEPQVLSRSQREAPRPACKKSATCSPAIHNGTAEANGAPPKAMAWGFLQLCQRSSPTELPA